MPPGFRAHWVSGHGCVLKGREGGWLCLPTKKQAQRLALVQSGLTLRQAQMGRQGLSCEQLQLSALGSGAEGADRQVFVVSPRRRRRLWPVLGGEE